MGLKRLPVIGYGWVGGLLLLEGTWFYPFFWTTHTCLIAFITFLLFSGTVRGLGRAAEIYIRCSFFLIYISDIEILIIAVQ